jgi:predicted nucleotidyltransferase
MAEIGGLNITESDLAIVRRILQEHVAGRPVYVFGSRVNGRAQRRSDLDLAIGGDDPMPLRVRAALAEAFDESDLPIEVDVVDLSAISETFRARISSEWIPLDLSSALADPKEVHA